MPFTPEEIESKEFLPTIRGYDKEEVREFLRAVADDYRDGGSARADEGSFEALGEEVTAVLSTARESAERMKWKAREEADALKRNAEAEADRIREASKKAAQQRRDDAEAYASDVKQRADDQARLTRKEAETYAAEITAEADTKAKQMVEEATRRVEVLRAAETELMSRLQSVNLLISSAMTEVEAPSGALEASDADAITVEAAGGADGSLSESMAANGKRDSAGVDIEIETAAGEEETSNAV